LALGAGLIGQAVGCTRPFFRKRADNEVAEVLAQKDKYAAWKIENWHVYPDPRARFGDPTDPDHPPKPPDDPAAYDLSPNPQKPGKAGVERVEGTGYLELIAQWDKENRERRSQEETEERRMLEEPPILKTEKTEQPGQEMPKAVSKAGPSNGQDAAIQKVAFLQAADEPVMKAPPVQRDAIAEAKAKSLVDITGQTSYLLTLDQAAELAMFNSREYQDQRENLYLAALPVTVERFSFMAQFFAGQEAIRAYAGREAAGGPANNWALTSGTGLSKVLPTGALLLLNFANRTVFDFINPKKTLSVTTLNFDAIQPLLRGGGQAVALESLTTAERNLVYATRTYARFRKEIYVAIASANGGSISGSAFQPTGVLSNIRGGNTRGIGASGLAPGVIAPARTGITEPIIAPLGPGSLFLAAAITPPPAGYLNTMLQKIQVYIDQENIDVLSGILLRYRGLLEGDVVAPLQVQSVEQQLLAGRATLLLDQTQYLQALDAFKVLIGLPMQLNIEMDDSVLRPLLNQFRRARAIIENEGIAVSEASALIPLENAPRLRADLLRLFQKSAIAKGTPFAATIRERLAEWEKLSNKDLDARLEELRKEAQRLLDLQADLQKKDQLLSPADQDRLRDVNAQRDLGTFERALRLYEANYVEMGKPKKPDVAGERQRIRQFQSVVFAWQKVMVEARDEQWAVVRASWPELPRCCVDGVDLIHDDIARAQAAGAQHALLNRLDLMNNRALVVDAWRQLAVYANALMGFFNVQYHLSANSPVAGAQPLNIGGSGNAHELILNTELPLTRIQERNNYRASLIAYQRERRALQEAEDLAVQAVRNELYLLRQYADQYRLQQRQLQLAYQTIDSSLESLEAPTAPPAPPGVPRTTPADGPAALTSQLLAAQRSLPMAQNALLTLWIQYLNFRLQLYRDLELMPLDARGVWIDEIRDCDCGVGLQLPPGPAAPPAGNGLPLPVPELLPLPKETRPPGDGVPHPIPELVPPPKVTPPAPGPTIN
jgi:hypothetical protein